MRDGNPTGSDSLVIVPPAHAIITEMAPNVVAADYRAFRSPARNISEADNATLKSFS